MHYVVLLMSILTFTAAAFAGSNHAPSCLADCLKNVTNPCDQDSIGGLFTCLNDQCIDPASGITLMLTPKAQYSCQDTLIPGIQHSSSPMTVVGDASCVTNPTDFRSFIPYPGPASQMDIIAKTCKLELFPGPNCIGDAAKINLNAFSNTKCAFLGGRSVRMSCGEPLDPGLNPYRYLERMCANSTSISSNSSSPTSYGSTSVAITTVHTPSIAPHNTGTISASRAPCVTGSSDHAKTPPSLALANNEQPMKPSVAALVGVLAAAIVMI